MNKGLFIDYRITVGATLAVARLTLCGSGFPAPLGRRDDRKGRPYAAFS